MSHHMNSTAGQANTGKRRSTIKHIFFALLVIAAGIALTSWLMQTGPKSSPRKPKRVATLVEVMEMQAKPYTTHVQATGVVTPAVEVALTPLVGGEIIWINPNLLPGGRIGAGEKVVQIDPTDYKIAARQLQSAVKTAENNLELEQGNQVVAQKELELLGEQVSEEDKKLILRKPQLETLEASLESARAQYEQALLNIKRSAVVVPFNAIVEAQQVNLGSRVSQSTPLATLIGTDEFWVEASVPVSKLPWITIPKDDDSPGAAVTITTTTSWGERQTHRGRVIRLAPTLEEQGRMARLIIRVEDPLALSDKSGARQPLLAGSFVRVTIEGRQLPSAMALSRNYLHDGTTVWLMAEDNTLVYRTVDILYREESRVFITGVHEGEKLVVSNLSAPVAGMALRLAQPVSATGKPAADAKQRKKMKSAGGEQRGNNN